MWIALLERARIQIFVKISTNYPTEILQALLTLRENIARYFNFYAYNNIYCCNLHYNSTYFKIA